MAKSTPLERMNKRYGISTKKSSALEGTDKLNKTISNYQTRLKEAGIEDTVEDTRNPLEKALNLEKDQNVLFDILEIINRPQNAILTGINNALSGDSFTEGLKEGITGETKTSGKDILVDQFNMNDEAGKLDLADVLGFGIDIVSDPLDLALIPVTGGASKAAEIGADTAKTLNKVSDAKKGIEAASGIVEGANAAKEGLHFVSANQLLGKGVGKALKGTGKLADKGIENYLGLLDSKNANKIQKLVDQGMDATEAARALNVNPNKLGLYQDIKKSIGNTIDSAKNVGGFVGRSRGINEAKDFDRAYGNVLYGQLKESIDNVSSSLGGKYTSDDISKKLVNAIQSEKNWGLTGQDIINRFVEGKGKAFIPSDTQANEVMKVLDQFGIKTKKISNSIGDVDEALKVLKKQGINATREELLEDLGTELTIDNKNLKDLVTIRDALFNPTTREVTNDLGVENLTKFTDLNFGSKNAARIDNQLIQDRNFFNQTPELQDLYNKASNAVKDYATDVSNVEQGLDAGSAATRGYVKRSRTAEDLRRSSSKEFESVEENLNSAIAQSNAYQRQRQLRDIVSKSAQNEKLSKGIYKVDEKTGELLRDSQGNLIRDNAKYNEYIRRTNTSIQNIKTNIDEIKKVQTLGKEGIVPSTLNMSKKRQKQVNDILKTYGLQESLQEIESQLGDIAKITPENSAYIDKLKDATESFLKEAKGKESLVKNPSKAITQYADDAEEFLGNIKNTGEAVSKDFKSLDQAAKRLKTTINEVKTVSSKEIRTANKEIKKAYNEGLKLGKQQLKANQAISKNTKSIQLAKESNADMLDNLQKKLNLNEQKALQTKTADEIFKKTQEKIAKNVEDIAILTDEVSQSYFKERFEDTFMDYVKGAVQQNAGTKKFYDALASGLFTLDGDYVKTYTKGAEIPYGFTKINGHSLSNKFNAYKSIMSEDGKAMGYILDELKDKDILIDKQLLKSLDMGGSNVQSMSPLLKFIDGVNNTFKKFSTLTPGFQIRNITGNASNMYLSGVNMKEMPTYYKEATSIMNNAKDLFKKKALGTLSGDEIEQFNKLKKFYSAGFADAITKGYGMEAIKNSGKGILNKVSKASLQANNYVDSLNRMSLLLYAEKHPEYVQKLGKSSAIDTVRHVLFDPSNLSDVEEKVIKRIIPFYTFTKQNLLFQADNILKNTPKYNKLYKVIRDSYNDLDEDSYYSYQRDNMQIPLPFNDDNGNQLFLKANLPTSDLGEFLSNPIQKVTSSLTPIIKAPIEMVTGKSLFTGEDANYNTLKNTLSKLGVSDKGIQNTAQAAETILNNFGLQNISTNLIKKVQAILNSEGDKSPQQIWAEIFRSVVQNTNQENVQTSKLYDEQEGYQQLMSELKKQGIDVPTIREINASNKNKLRNMKNKRAKSN